MAYLDRIHACNGWDPDGFVPFESAQGRLGWLRPQFAERLADWPHVFQVNDAAVRLVANPGGFEDTTVAVAEVLGELTRRGVMPAPHGEWYPVGRRREQPEFLIDREAAPRFGVRAYGQHINGFVREGDRIAMWIGRRSRDKRNFPGKLDHLAAGGLPHGLGLMENVRKECWEEAGIPADVSLRARSVGAVTYCAETEHSLKPDTIFCYDLELPADFVPRCNDGEMESFQLLPLHEVQALVCETDEFKPNCNLVLIDFLIRHGYLGPEQGEFLDIVQGLHPALP